jgi:hypothetical protein
MPPAVAPDVRGSTGNEAVAGPPQALRAWGVLGAALFAALTVTTAVVDPSQPGHYPVCPVRALTGLACPGCGSLRALHALTQGDLLTALDRNAALVVTLPLVAVGWLRLVAGRPRWPARATHRVAVAALVLLGAWTVSRNLPWAPFTALAP